MISEPQYVTNPQGERTGVLLSIADYEAILEDLQDLAALAERRDDDRVSLEEVKQQLKTDGLLQD